jgi:hypothetical protein
VEAVIEGSRMENVLSIPASALSSRNSVFVVEGETLSPRDVVILGRRDEGNSLLVSEIDLADGLVVSPPSNARNGLAVQVNRDE